MCCFNVEILLGWGLAAIALLELVGWFANFAAVGMINADGMFDHCSLLLGVCWNLQAFHGLLGLQMKSSWVLLELLLDDFIWQTAVGVALAFVLSSSSKSPGWAKPVCTGLYAGLESDLSFVQSRCSRVLREQVQILLSLGLADGQLGDGLHGISADHIRITAGKSPPAK
ncbi:hypothetical protein Nepgr_013542 [Nepenthes gracilis]|uniref:Uncharacterized protein n=1 Tax=Nepenthes gracilis TaxID=150966 RepID=A0AAD3XPG1_NEPGR|nr:hypothetical protein Nepgr_013542 [Nepenthes gracilis]